ncbi:hypothetical protein ACQPW1_18935 [Nocardia sp. CA-128927]|uniref:hypothetical protein n=1 Tax=Nocardia sp. CA-128927 TaxID=3239975 RepID=UPI003D97A9BC
MKRVLTVLVGMVAIWGVAACSDDSKPAPSTTTAKATTTTSAAPTTAITTTTAAVAPQPTTTQQQRGADGSTNNNLSPEYCAKNQDPGCPLGSYIGPNAIPSPNGDGTWVPCEGTICTNPNYGAGPETTPPPLETTSTAPQDTARVEGAPCEGDGHWVHLTGGDAAHYGTEWLCRH